MAAMFQEIIHPESQFDHLAMPYHIVKRIASQISPEIKDDTKKLIGLCFISLHTLNPGMTLIDHMVYANDNPDKDISKFPILGYPLLDGCQQAPV